METEQTTSFVPVIRSTSDIKADELKVLIYGESGAGKTYLLGTLPPKTIILNIEKGLLTLKNKSIDYIDIMKFNEIDPVLKSVAAMDYDNIAVDSVTDIFDLYARVARFRYPEDSQSRPMWNEYHRLVGEFISKIKNMKKNVICLASEVIDKDDVGRRFGRPDLIGKSCGAFVSGVDFVFNLKCFEREGKEVRALVTHKKHGVVAKDRSQELDEYEKPDLGMIIDKIFKEKKDV